VKRHYRENYYVLSEGVITLSRDPEAPPDCYRPSTAESLRKFRFSRLGEKGQQLDVHLLEALADAMTVDVPNPDVTADPRPDADTPAGFTYLSQFVDHDLTKDITGTDFGEDVTVAELIQGRSPALDLDSVYGRGPGHVKDSKFYADDGVRLKLGKTGAVGFPDSGTNIDMDGFDLPRTGVGSTQAERRTPLIPDGRNDENLAVAQTHVAFIRFHNEVVDRLAAANTPSVLLFDKAKAEVVRHYQWLVLTDLLPRIVDPAIVDDVFTNGRRFFEPPNPHNEGYDEVNDREPGDYETGHGPKYYKQGDYPTMPIEFSVAAYRLGHSMVRGAYQWNRVFNSAGPGRIATLLLLFTFTGVNGIFRPLTSTPPPPEGVEVLDDPNAGDRLVLPTNWITDFRRLYEFDSAADPDLAPPNGQLNLAKRIDTLLVNPLATLPAGSFGGRGQTVTPPMRNLAFRNLVRANMVELASGQQMADMFKVRRLTDEQIIQGDGTGANLDALTDNQKTSLLNNTPLWFYILREAELNEGRLGQVGGRIVAEVFHRAIEGSRISIIREPFWRPSLGPDSQTFRMTDLLLVAYKADKDLLNPLGDAPPAAPPAPPDPAAPH
jgi:hypothetical protein